jgi:hypothetical protein
MFGAARTPSNSSEKQQHVTSVSNEHPAAIFTRVGLRNLVLTQNIHTSTHYCEILFFKRKDDKLGDDANF